MSDMNIGARVTPRVEDIAAMRDQLECLIWHSEVCSPESECLECKRYEEARKALLKPFLEYEVQYE